MVSNLLLTVSNFIFPLITFPYTTRILSNESLGTIYYIDAFAKYFILFSSLGIPAYAVREIAKVKSDPERFSKLATELLIIQGILSLAFTCIFLTMPLWLSKLEGQTSLVQLACISIVSTSFLMEWFYQGLGKYSYITIRSVVIRSLSILLIVFLVKSPNDYLTYCAIPAFLTLLNATVNFTNYLRNFHTGFSGKIQLMQHIKPLLILFSINVSVSVYTVLDTIILGSLSDAVNVSYYNVPLKLVKMVWSVAASLGVVFIPHIAGLYKEGDMRSIKGVVNKNLNIVFITTIPFAFFCLLFPREILTTISGDKYLAASPALQILSIIPFIIGVCNVMGTQFLMPIGKEKTILYATIAGLISSLALNFILIPKFQYLGATVSCLISELIVCTYITFFALKIIQITPDFKLLIQIAFSLLLAYIPCVFFKVDNSLILLLTTGSTFALCFLTLQYIYFRNEFVYSLFKIKLK